MLQAFQKEVPDDVRVEVRNCFGQCGNGPMVLVLPDQIWYSQVQPKDVPRIVEQHLRQGKPFKARLYRVFHPDPMTQRRTPWVWAMVGTTVLGIVGLSVVGIYWSWLKLQ